MRGGWPAVRSTARNEDFMDTSESVGSHLARLLPAAGDGTLDRLERAAQRQAFVRRDLLHARGVLLPPFVTLDGYVMARRVAETGQVRGALIAGAGYFGGTRSISDPEGEALYELVALTDGSWATWDPRFVRELALHDAGLAVSLLDRSSDFAVVLNMRLDERSFESARQRLATILTRYGKAIFDTPHPVAQRSDLAAMIGTSRVMMYRALRELEAQGLVSRQRSGGINVLDEERLAGLVTIAPPDGAPAF
jgi:CRP-like cAMP-binding protein